ncbi:MAG: hypothetical protein R6U13_14370, partial [Desulfatiglandaceae bacterium]
IDILVKDSEELPDEFRHVLEWRIMRSLPEKYWDRVQFHYDSFHGPFTDNLPVFDLTIERVNEDNQVFRMEADTDDADVEKEKASEEEPPLIAWVQGQEQEQEELDKQEPRAASRELKAQCQAGEKDQAHQDYQQCRSFALCSHFILLLFLG